MQSLHNGGKQQLNGATCRRLREVILAWLQLHGHPAVARATLLSLCRPRRLCGVSLMRGGLCQSIFEQQLLKCCPLVQPHGSHGGVANVGIANRAKRLRRQCRENHVVWDVGDIPNKKNFMVRLPCHLAHYGVCRSVDEGIFKNAIDIGKRIETCFKKSHVGTYFCITDSLRRSFFVHLCHVRTRKTHARITHVFAEVQLEATTLTSAIVPCAVGDRIRCMTAWDVARQRCRMKLTDVLVQSLDVDIVEPTGLSCGTVRLRAGCGPGSLDHVVQVFPPPKRAVAEPVANPSELDLLPDGAGRPGVAVPVAKKRHCPGAR